MTAEKWVEASEHLLGPNVRQRRVESELSQQQVAAGMARYWVHWHQTVVAKVEAGQRALKLTEAYALAAVLGTDIDGLVTGRGLRTPFTLKRSSSEKRGGGVVQVEEELAVVAAGAQDTYTVRPGDTWEALEETSGVPVAELQALNGRSAEAPLLAGEILRFRAPVRTEKSSEGTTKVDV